MTILSFVIIVCIVLMWILVVRPYISFQTQQPFPLRNQSGLEKKYPSELTQALIGILKDHFNMGELVELMLALGIHHEDISGDNRGSKVNEFVWYFERRHRLHELIWSVQRERPVLKLESLFNGIHWPRERRQVIFKVVYVPRIDGLDRLVKRLEQYQRTEENQERRQEINNRVTQLQEFRNKLLDNWEKVRHNITNDIQSELFIIIGEIERVAKEEGFGGYDGFCHN